MGQYGRNLATLHLRSRACLTHQKPAADRGMCDLARFSAMPYGYFVGRNDPTRRVLRTEEHNVFGNGPEPAEAGDVICFVNGASAPYLMRPLAGGRYELIGEAYLYGIDTNEFLRRSRENCGMKSLRIV